MAGQGVKEQVIPVEGMGATYSIGSDRYAYTVVKVLSPKRIWVQADITHQVGSFYGTQSYVCEPNPSAPVREFSLRKDGTWREKGQYDPYGTLELGIRHTELDPGF